MNAVTVALASEAEAPACLALLPGVRTSGIELLIARDAGVLVGAAAVVWMHVRDGGFPLDIMVLPPARRRGVGRRLVEAAETLIEGEAPGLWSIRRLDEASEAAAFARACGFVARVRERHFRAEAARVAGFAKPMVERLRARGHVPEDARVIPLREAPLDEAAWLISAEFGAGPHTAHAHLRDGAGGLDLDRSLAVMQGERMAGVVLVRWADGAPIVDAAVVAPAWRQGWANAVLVDAIAEVGLRGGQAEFRFHCDEDVLATLQLAERAQAVEESTAALFYRQAAS